MAEGFFESLGRHWWVLVVYGAIAIIFGIIAIAQPFQAAAAMIWAFGVVAIAEAIASVVMLFDKREDGPSKGMLAFYALSSLLFGGLALARPVAMAGAMMYLLAAWLLVAGVVRFGLAIRLRKAIENEWMLILSAVLVFGLGVMIAMYPAAGLLAVMLWVAVGALIYGVLQVVAGFRARKLLGPTAA